MANEADVSFSEDGVVVDLVSVAAEDCGDVTVLLSEDGRALINFTETSLLACEAVASASAASGQRAADDIGGEGIEGVWEPRLVHFFA